MKKKMSRFISALLVFAMVCAMVPAAFAAVTGVAITGAPESAVEIGYTATLTATVSGDEGTSQEVTWTSSDPAIVSVNAGAITALDAGTATITATSTEDTSKSATCTITVNGSVTGYTVNPATLNVVKGTTRADLAVKLPEKVTVAFGKARSAECRVTWNTDNFDGTKLGAQTISAKSVDLPTGAVQGDTQLPSITVNVSDAPTIEVTSEPSNLVVKKGATGKTLTVTATAKAGDGTTDLTSRLTYQWKSSDSKNGTYATVSGGTASAFVVPTGTIGTKYYSCVITVTDPATNAEATATVGPFTVTVCDEYSVELVSNAETGKAITVGTNPSISATVKKFNEDKSAYETVSSYNDLEWSVSVSGGQYYKYAELISGKRSVTLNTIGTVSATGTTKMTVRATIGGTDYYGEITFEVKAGSVQNITVPSVGGGATFSASTFMTAVKEATNSTEFDYVMFSTPYYGTLYESSASKNKITTSEPCYYNPSKSETALDGIYFVPDSNAKSPYVNYVAYNMYGGVVATGTVVINDSAGDITYDTTAGQTVAFDEDDFQKFFAAAYTKGTLDYVNFDVSYDDNLNTRAYGYLYESSSKSADYVDSRTDYYYDATSRQDDLDDIVFTAGTRTSKYTITVPFTAYGTQSSSSTKTVSVNGYVTITVNDGKATSIYSIGTSFKGEIYKAMIPDNYTEREVSGYYVEFGTVTGGKLFYDYTSISDAKEVTAKTLFYFDAGKNELDLEDVYFVPEAGATTAKVAYTIYNGKTKVDTGTLSFTVIQQTKSNYFSDITESNTGKWSANAIDFMYVNELVTGTASKTFSPNQTMNRAMLVTILYRVAGKPSVKSVSNPFTDVKSGSYYYDAVLWAYKNNIVTGTSSTTFNPTGAVTREQIAAILYRYAGSPKTTGTLTGYTDKNKVSTYATTAMEWAVKNGIITGKSATTLDPAGLGTRAEVAVMLHRYLTK